MALENFKPEIVKPGESTYYDSLGIPKERAMFLIDVVTIILDTQDDISVVMLACVEVAKTPNEVCFVLFKAGQIVGVNQVMDEAHEYVKKEKKKNF